MNDKQLVLISLIKCSETFNEAISKGIRIALETNTDVLNEQDKAFLNIALEGLES